MRERETERERLRERQNRRYIEIDPRRKEREKNNKKEVRAGERHDHARPWTLLPVFKFSTRQQTPPFSGTFVHLFLVPE